MNRRTRFAVVASHPIPYYVTLYRALAEHAGFDVHAFFSARIGLTATPDPGMGVDIRWTMDVLAGYDHTFLPGAENVIGTGFRDINNPAIGNALSDYAPDVVLMHGYAQGTMLRALLWCRMKGVPALMISDRSLPPDASLPKRLVKRLVLPPLLRQFTAFLTIGDSNETFLKTYGVPRQALFRTPVIVEEGFWKHRAKRDAIRNSVRSELGLGADDLTVLYVGKLLPRKRPGDLVAALEILRAMPPTPRPIKVFFAGDGSLRAELERQIADAGVPARLLGFVNIDALPRYFCAADVLAHPAEAESFGIIAIEAAIIGLPLVFGDRVGALGPTSIAQPDKNALVHPSGDIDALARLLHRLASEPDTLARLGEASLRISHELDWPSAVAGATAAVDYCLAKKRPPAARAAPAPTTAERSGRA